MRTRTTRRGSPYRCQSKASYIAMEILDLLVGLISGSSGIASGGRWYVVEAALPYAGRFGLRCRSKLGLRLDISRVSGYSPALQAQLRKSFMDLEPEPGSRLPDGQLETALLPSVCALGEGYPEIAVTARRAISIRIRKTARLEIPEVVVDDLYADLMTQAQRLRRALLRLEAGGDGPPPD